MREMTHRLMPHETITSPRLLLGMLPPPREHLSSFDMHQRRRLVVYLLLSLYTLNPPALG